MKKYRVWYDTENYIEFEAENDTQAYKRACEIIRGKDNRLPIERIERIG